MRKRISNPILSQHHIGPPLHLPLSFFVKGKVSSTYLHFLQGVQFEKCPNEMAILLKLYIFLTFFRMILLKKSQEKIYGFSNTAI